MRGQFDDAWMEDASANPGFSYPADKPGKRIDYILLHRGDKLRAKRSWIVNTLASDHVPVVADVEFK
jgi:endonuclease/exonuclease/phosphatase family metal-dependent hydrolase